MQDIEIDGEIDVIVSEWMGYMLLYEVDLYNLIGFSWTLVLLSDFMAMNMTNMTNIWITFEPDAEYAG